MKNATPVPWKSQSNLARFLAALMSTETCRKIVVACAQAGFLLRERNPYGTIFAIGRQSGVLFRAVLARSAPTDQILTAAAK